VVESGPAAGLRIDLARASGDYRTGANEVPVQRTLASVLRPGQVFYDVGSNIGFFALLASRLVGRSGRVYAFEPVKANAEAIRRNAELNRFRHLEVLEVAVSDRNGSARLLLSAHPGGATLSNDDAPPDPTGVVDVSTVTLDALVASRRIAPPDVVKIDVEGAEEAVLAGMTDTLAGHRPTLVCELDSADSAVLEQKIATFRAFADARAYRVTDLPTSYAETSWHVYHAVARPLEAPDWGQRSTG